MNVRVPTLALTGLLVISTSLSAQTLRYQPPRAAAGVSFLIAEPTGEFSDFVNAGYGADFWGRLALEPRGLVSLRGDFGFAIYGYESKRVCFDGVGCRVQARLETSNSIFFGGIGPELALPMDWVRPYLNAFLGFGYFSTSSSLESLWGDDDSFPTENLGDGTFSWGWGGGMEFYVHQGRVPIAINLGARYHENGVMEYLREGDILDHPDGSITLFPIVSEANYISYRIGVSIGIGGRRDDDEHHRQRSRW